MVKIDIRFTGGLTQAQQTDFVQAAARWEQVLPLPLSLIRLPDGEETDGLIIEASGIENDGPGGILGSAGPTLLRPNSELPAKGVMNFDVADIEALEAEGTFLSVIIHEMAHVLGVGTLWVLKNLIEGAGTEDPVFTGSSARCVYASLRRSSQLLDVPIANTGGPGTREGHWRESVFIDELMTGFLSGQRQPLSRLTIASLQDLGYIVNPLAADPYDLGLGSRRIVACPMCKRDVAVPTPVILPESSLL